MAGLLLSLALALAVSSRADGPRAAVPVVLLSLDDLREDRVRAELMPNLSALLAESVYFASAYSQASWTVPSHVSLFSSRYPATHGAAGKKEFLQFRAPRPAPDLVTQLKARGYAAEGFVNSPFFEREFGVAPALDEVFVLPAMVDPLPAAADWLLAADSAPFVFAHTYAVHNFADILDGVPRGPDGRWRCPALVDPLKRESLRHWRDRPGRSCDHVRERYDRAAYCFDQALGRFVTRLKAEGLWDRALVAVVSDHGESLCEGAKGGPVRKGHGEHGYDEQLHVPWLLKLPGGRFAGRRVESPVELVDVAPTLLSALGLPVPSYFQGRDRMPEAAGAPGDATAPVYAETDQGVTARARGWKLIWSPDGYELYDLARDPGETRNLARRERAQLRAMEALLLDHYARQRGPWKLRLRAARRTEFRLRVASDPPAAHAAALFHERGDGVERSTTTGDVEARFVVDDAGDEDWLVVEPSTPTARVTLHIEIDGRPAGPGEARIGGKALPGPSPWAFAPGDGYDQDEPATARDGITVWRSRGGPTATRVVELPRDLLERLRRAGYAE